MIKKAKAHTTNIFDPASISRIKKERFLMQLSEDDFRDKVVRPLFLRMGFKVGRELCGPQEEGKDTIFIDHNKIGTQEIWAVQTKKGSINLSRKTSQNITEVSTQLKTAHETKVTILISKKRVYPDRIILCASGKINDAAQKWICDKVQDPHIIFMGREEIIPKVDEYFPEFWWEIDSDKFPYLRNLRDILLKSSDTITLAELDIKSDTSAPITDTMYVNLYLHRLTLKTVKVKGQVDQQPNMEQIPIQGVLNRREKLIHIVGEAGSGKTTALRRLAFSVIEKVLTDTNIKTVPIIIKSTAIANADNEEDLINLIIESVLQYVDSKKPCFTDEDLKSGNLLILIDALDEVNDADRRCVIDKIQNFHDKYPLCKIILTSRNYPSIMNLQEVSNFVRFNITPINLKQAQKLATRLSKGKSLPPTQTNEMLRQLHEVHGLELNPLLVTVFVATSEYSRRDIPANITELFKKFTEMMLGRWDLKKGLAQQYQAPLKDFLLKKLAFYMHTRKMVKISLVECKEIFRHVLIERGHETNLDILFDEIVYRSGLFRMEDDGIVFRHSLLQEFFAGRGVPSVSYFHSVITDDWWKHSLVFYFGENPDAHIELNNIIDNISEFEGNQLYRAAVAIGLAIQACYLSKVSDKAQSMQSVISSLARAEEVFLREAKKYNPQLPLTAFIGYYLFGRNSVACQAINEDIFSKAQKLLDEQSSSYNDIIIFWHIVSLIESGCIDKAETLIKKYKPADNRLLLALHLGAFSIQHLYITEAHDKREAKRICDFISPKINYLRYQALKEMKSMILEVQQGKIKALPSRVK